MKGPVVIDLNILEERERLFTAFWSFLVFIDSLTFPRLIVPILSAGCLLYRKDIGESCDLEDTHDIFIHIYDLYITHIIH